jgi:ubiquinone/menaquinone biosynthesis C-methylase UbiE
MRSVGLAARLYDPLLGPLVSGFRAAGMELAPGRPGLRVLDVGCGTGSHLDRYLRRGSRVAGIDTSEAMLAVARRRLGRGARLVAADAASIPFSSGGFDLVIAMTLLHELDPASRGGVLEEMMRVAAPGGRLLVIDHHPGRPQGPRGRFIRWSAAAIERIAGAEHHRNFREFVSSGGLPVLAASCGLVVERWSVVASGTMGAYLLRPAR